MILENIIPHIRVSIDRKCYKGWSVPERTIFDHEFVFILGGKGAFTVEGKRIPVKKGYLYYFYPGLVHSADTDLEDPMHFYGVHFDYDLIGLSEEGRSYTRGNGKLPLPYLSTVNNFYKCSEILKSLHGFWMGKKPGYEVKCRSLMLDFFYEATIESIHGRLSPTNKARVEAAIDHMLKNYRSSISLQELCSLVNLTPAYFSNIFKCYTDQSPIGYLNRLRIDIAKEILLNGDHTVKEVSSMVGFHDEFYFSRLFKKLEGSNPSSYAHKFYSNIVHGE